MAHERLVADFHIHSKYSRACSKELTLPGIAAACERKGIDLVTTADFTHPKWMEHICEELEEVAQGMYALKNNRSRTRFILTTELSSIYSQGGKVRRIHVLVFAPSIHVAQQFTAALVARGCNVASDGRPILGLSAQEIMRVMHAVSPDMILVPAHAWTPWFSVFGSKSGFDSLEECFGEFTPFVRAIETGLSSDPPMNWSVSSLDDITLISNSDAHSLEKLGREATVFAIDPQSSCTYHDIIDAIQNKSAKKIIETIEFFPEEGKYHVDGHAACNFFCDPQETKRLNGLCPKCNKKLTVGVLYRTQELADKKNSEVIHMQPTFRHVIPLVELIAYALGVGSASKKIHVIYDRLIASVGSEFYILLDATYDEIFAASSEEIADVVMNMRNGDIEMTPGYDGVFGKILVKKNSSRAKKNRSQKNLL